MTKYGNANGHVVFESHVDAEFENPIFVVTFFSEESGQQPEPMAYTREEAVLLLQLLNDSITELDRQTLERDGSQIDSAAVVDNE